MKKGAASRNDYLRELSVKQNLVTKIESLKSSIPITKEEIEEYKELLSEGLVKPTEMELYICNVDGSDLKKITSLGGANWAPFFHPSDKKIIFSSNHKSKRGFPFNLFMIDIDGGNLEQITYDTMFDAFPVFSNNGKKFVFASNRNNNGTRSTNLFITDCNVNLLKYLKFSTILTK